MGTIPVGFLKLPDLSRIKDDPQNEIPSSGMIHSSKVEQLYQLLLNKGDDLDLEEILDGHVLQHSLLELAHSELADFVKHTIYLNKDFIGWQEADRLVAELGKFYLASWELPEYVFINSFSELFSSILRWELSTQLKDLLMTYADSGKVPFVSPEVIIEKIKSNYAFWSFKDLWQLFDGLVDQITSGYQEFLSYKPLLDSLSDLFENQIKNPNTNLSKKIALISIFSRSYAKISDQALFYVQDLVDRIWLEVENSYDDRTILSYRYLFVINYAHIGLEYYKYNIGYASKKKIVTRIISSFLTFEGMNIQEWLAHFSKAQPDEALLEHIFQGYLTIGILLHNSYLELPKSAQRELLAETITTLFDSLYKTTYEYFSNQLDLDVIDGTSIFNLITYIHKIKSNQKSRQGLVEVLTTSFSYLIHHRVDVVDLEKLILPYSEVIKDLHNESEAKLFVYHLQMMTDTFPFDRLYKSINLETKGNLSIVASETFESEIIGFISNMMEKILQTYYQTHKIEISRLEKMYYFLSEWLIYFSVDKPEYQDVLMILSPILSICYVELIQGFYEQQMVEKAFLTYLSMQHFVAIMRDEMKVVSQEQRAKTLSYLTDDFKELISEWQVSNLLDINIIRDRVKSIELSFSGGQGAVSGMIDDDIMLGFLEMTNQIESFIAGLHENMDIKDLTEILFKKANVADPHFFSRIGKRYSTHVKLPFPLIRNIYQYSAALSIIPLDLTLPDSIYQQFLSTDFMGILEGANKNDN